MSLTRIKFPVLKSLSIDEYELFPGKDKAGIHHDFLPGVTVIAGINGLGKTTLLNVILRCLTGSREPRKFDPYNPVGGVHDMRSTRADYFSQRVLDEARNATADAEFYFGDDVVRIKRSLHNLEILGLWKNGAEIDGSQEDLREAIVRFSGAGDEYDFFYVVRSFTFFLEDKVSLIWNPQGQFEIFRILFSSPEQARELARLADAIKRIDSQHRNGRFQLNKDRRRLERLTIAAEDLSALEQSVRAAQLATDRARAALDEHQKLVELASLRRAALREKTEKIHLEVEEATRSYQSLVETFFTAAFPSLSATTQLVLNNLASETGCLICDNPHPAYPEEFIQRAFEGLCPFCGDDTTSHPSLKMDAEGRQRLADEGSRLAQCQEARAVLEDELRRVEGDLGESYAERSRLSTEHAGKRAELEVLQARMPASSESRDLQLIEINKKQSELDELLVERDTMTSEYEKLLEVTRRTMETLKEKLTTAFGEYAGEFLAERCTLSWEPARWRLGEEGELLSFPQFTVEMTSALSQSVGSPRKDENQVSESQKEFIDLAFRMALFDAVRDTRERAMLVIETPEASLDAVFVGQAGQLLRRFAVKDEGRGNVVIATTNLNRENMLRSLLGLDDDYDSEARQEAPLRVINLLVEAAPNAAMRKHQAAYARSFDDAMGVSS